MEDARTLIQMAHQGDKAARERLITENMGLVWSIARRFSGRGCELEDLFQIGSIGLMKAVDKFDTSFDVRFSTYAVPMIAGEIKRFLRDDGIIKVSRSLKELAARAKSAREELTYKFGREPTIEEIAGELGTSREEVAACLEAGAEVDSLNRPLCAGDEGSACLMDRLEEESREEELLDRMVLKELLAGLAGQEREVIVRRYFFEHTQSRIAADLGHSQVQVSRMEKRILKRLRERCEPLAGA